MEKRFSIATGALTVFAALLALLLVMAVPALAHHKEGHDNGGGRTADEAPAEDTGPHAPDDEGEPRGESADECTNTHEADQSGNGANTSGPYDSTCDGSASRNGNGGGSATGRPCAGCVGNADNKNPPGQMPDGKHDGNAGYECDGNNGVGRGNPAHSACEAETETETESKSKSKPKPRPQDEVQPGVVPAPALAPAPAPAKVLGLTIRRPAIAPGVAPAVTAPGAVLPFTGASALLLALIGLGMMASGAVVLRAVRK